MNTEEVRIFIFTDTAPPEIYTLSLHDALPISRVTNVAAAFLHFDLERAVPCQRRTDRKSTRLNSSHLGSSYAVFCLKKKSKQQRGRMTGKAWHGSELVYGHYGLKVLEQGRITE